MGESVKTSVSSSLTSAAHMRGGHTRFKGSLDQLGKVVVASTATQTYTSAVLKS